MLPQKCPVSKEGFPFIWLSSLAALSSAMLELEIAAVFFLLFTAFILYFFRDPERVIPAGEDMVVSPADGSIIKIDKTSIDPINGSDAIKVSIFMNIFNCHVNRAPISGRIERIRYQEGSFVAANLEGASIKNEQNAILIKGKKDVLCTVVQIAGLIARRIVCWVEPEDEVRKGERFGMIRFGSRLDVYLPLRAEILVKKRSKVFAGQTPMAKIVQG